ncbi:universal stress protein [Roseomonas sp. CCTCC AB2023176]|uniref:universal stress protein n=1 Tax=Roseomonas sp. CCTCC AB2023176 TaxID=3342640 RepID=UPI0035D7F0E5
MLKSLLVALDDTPGAQAAAAVALTLARSTGARLTAATILDLPHTRDASEPVPPGGGAFLERRNARLQEQAEQDAAAASAAFDALCGDTPHQIVTLGDAPQEALLRAGAAHDLIVLGRDSTLGREETEDGLAPTIPELLRDGSRPLLVVPPGATLTDGPVIAAYDGSTGAADALQAFALLGLAGDRPVKAVSVSDDRAVATQQAGEAAGLLARHGARAEPVSILGDRPADAILAILAADQASMLVMGAFENSALRTYFTGSATMTLLREAPCPVFVHR